MKKLFLALMAVAAITLTCCDDKEDIQPSQEELDKALITAVKDALDTDGKALVNFLKNNGFTDMGGNVFQNGDESCDIAYREGGIVYDINLYTAISPSNFTATKNYFLRMEAACATVFPTGFEGECQLGENLDNFDNEVKFSNYMMTQVTEEQFTETWNRCRARSDFNDSHIREIIFENSLDAGVWVSDLHIWICKPE